jgi:hypothetical protein
LRSSKRQKLKENEIGVLKAIDVQDSIFDGSKQRQNNFYDITLIPSLQFKEALSSDSQHFDVNKLSEDTTSTEIEDIIK